MYAIHRFLSIGKVLSSGRFICAPLMKNVGVAATLPGNVNKITYSVEL